MAGETVVTIAPMIVSFGKNWTSNSKDATRKPRVLYWASGSYDNSIPLKVRRPLDTDEYHSCLAVFELTFPIEISQIKQSVVATSTALFSSSTTMTTRTRAGSGVSSA